MAFATSSVLGVDLQNSSATQLFALNSIVQGSDDSEWQYVKSTGVLLTGRFVTIGPEGTAYIAQTAILKTPSAVGNGYMLGLVQCSMADQEYAWVAKRGMNLILATTGTLFPGTLVGFGSASGMLHWATNGSSCTMAGIYITNSANTATSTGTTTARGILSYPRVLSTDVVGTLS